MIANRQGVFIKVAEPGDAQSIALLCRQFDYLTDSASVKTQLEDITGDSRQAVWVAFAGEQLVGWLHVFTASRIESTPFAEIGGLVVDLEHRRLGIGQQLVTCAAGWAQAKGFGKLRVRCAEQRTAAQAFYLKQGMSNTKTQLIFDKTLR